MEVHDSRAKRQEMIMYSDFISNLPDNVTDQILIRLPIREAVRTSILSTNWRYKWTTITQLVFHDHNMLPSPPPHNNNNNNSKDNKLINFIDRVLLLHSGFIHKFELSIKCLRISASMTDTWILFLSRKNIKELVLNFKAVLDRELYNLPTCIFSAQQISTLELQWCKLKPPPATFTGFSNLKSLDLRKTIFYSRGSLDCLISKCPLLERMTLIDCILDYHINICSPNLKYLYLFSPFQYICFENTPLLSHVSIGLRDYDIPHQGETETRNVVKLLSSLPSLKKFEVIESFLQFLTLSKIPDKLPFTCHHLNHLTLTLHFEDVNEMCVTLCLLSSSPNLQELHINSYPMSKPGHGIENFWEKRTHIDWKMSRLQVVKITSYTSFEFESGLEFIKLLLANSPMLEMLSIRPYQNIHETLESMTHGKKDMLLLSFFQLLRFKRASPKAVIEFPDYV